MDETIQAEVPLEPIGVPNASRTLADCLSKACVLWQLNVCRAILPDRITVDVSQLNIGDSIHLRQIQMPSGVTSKAQPISPHFRFSPQQWKRNRLWLKPKLSLDPK